MKKMILLVVVLLLGFQVIGQITQIHFGNIRTDGYDNITPGAMWDIRPEGRIVDEGGFPPGVEQVIVLKELYIFRFVPKEHNPNDNNYNVAPIGSKWYQKEGKWFPSKCSNECEYFAPLRDIQFVRVPDSIIYITNTHVDTAWKYIIEKESQAPQVCEVVVVREYCGAPIYQMQQCYYQPTPIMPFLGLGGGLSINININKKNNNSVNTSYTTNTTTVDNSRTIINHRENPVVVIPVGPIDDHGGDTSGPADDSGGTTGGSVVDPNGGNTNGGGPVKNIAGNTETTRPQSSSTPTTNSESGNTRGAQNRGLSTEAKATIAQPESSGNGRSSLAGYTPSLTRSPSQEYNTQGSTRPTTSPSQGYSNSNQARPTTSPSQGYSNSNQARPTTSPSQGYSNSNQARPTTSPSQGYSNSNQARPTTSPSQGYSNSNQARPTTSPSQGYSNSNQARPTTSQNQSYSNQGSTRSYGSGSGSGSGSNSGSSSGRGSVSQPRNR